MGSHLHSGALPPWKCEGELVCSAAGLGQQVRVHGCLVLGLGSLRWRTSRVSVRWQAATGSLPTSSTSAGGSEHLGEVPALDEVSGQVPGRWAMDNHPNIPPRHAGCGLSVNEIWGSQKSQKRGQGWPLGDM